MVLYFAASFGTPSQRCLSDAGSSSNKYFTEINDIINEMKNNHKNEVFFWYIMGLTKHVIPFIILFL